MDCATGEGNRKRLFLFSIDLIRAVNEIFTAPKGDGKRDKHEDLILQTIAIFDAVFDAIIDAIFDTIFDAIFIEPRDE